MLISFEHKKQPLLSKYAFFVRILKHCILAFSLIFGSLFIGAWGYHGMEGLPWLDSFLNASMLLSGEGPLWSLKTDAGKIFATIYSLFSGVIFISASAVLLSPIFHRILHHFHLNPDSE